MLAWDTTTVPNGRYVVRVTASDAPPTRSPSRSPADKESGALRRGQHRRPVVTAQLVAGSRRVRVQVKDDSSPIRRTEYSVDGGSWEEVHPADGISDTAEEAVRVHACALAGAGLPHGRRCARWTCVGNIASARVEVP